MLHGSWGWPQSWSGCTVNGTITAGLHFTQPRKGFIEVELWLAALPCTRQGVAETPVFNAYMLKGKLTNYEQKLTKDLLDRYSKADGKQANKKLKKLARLAAEPSGGFSGRPSGGGRQSGGVEPVQDDVDDAEGSWTIALLLHRWRSEATPRINACLEKRYGLLKVRVFHLPCVWGAVWGVAVPVW